MMQQAIQIMGLPKPKKKALLQLSTITSVTALLTACGPQGVIGIEGTDGDDITMGTPADELFLGSLGTDHIFGGGGNDTMSYQASPSPVQAYLDGTSGGGGHAQGDVLEDILNLIGSEFSDHLFGDANDNIYFSSAGADIMDGGLGNDIANYQNSPLGIILESNGNMFSGHAAGDFMVSIEGIVGSEFNDSINASLNITFIDGKGGNDVLRSETHSATIYGGDGNDQIKGSPLGDELHGDKGDDEIFGNGGSDNLFGDDGADKLHAGDDNSMLYGGGGHDKLYGGDGNDILYGDEGNDDFYSQKGTNQLFGGTGLDIAHYESDYFLFHVNKSANTITVEYTINGIPAEDYIHAVELIRNDNIFQTEYDVKEFWGTELDTNSKIQFTDEADFLNWLGSDTGYNYEGL